MVAVACWLAAAVAAAAAAALPRHVVMLVIDDLGWSDVSYKADMYPSLANLTGVMPPTPHLDALARAGVRLESYYTHPLCSPSRTAVRARARGRARARISILHVFDERRRGAADARGAHGRWVGRVPGATSLCPSPHFEGLVGTAVPSRREQC
jgi:hypothetical protein